MGLLNNFNKKSDERRKKENDERKELALTINNIFEGVQCQITFPDTQLKIVTYSGAAKGAATLALGLVGLAATSGIKHNEENRKLDTFVQVVEKGVVLKRATKDSKDLRIPFESIINVVRPGQPRSMVFINLLENQVIKVHFSCGSITNSIFVGEHFANVVNERACGDQYEEAGWGLEHATGELQEVKQEGNSLMDELERLGNLYEKGLLTEEEFATMKKKLIEG